MSIEESKNFIEKSIYFYTRRSLYIHLGLFLTVLLYTFSFAGKSMWSTKVTIVESSVRVDVVAMPKYTIQELKSFEQQSSSFDLEHGIDEEMAKVDDPEQLAYLVKKKKEDFASMLKKLSKKKLKKAPRRKKKVAKKSEEISHEMKKELSNLVLAGNKLSKGTALVGKYREGEMTAFENYISGLPAWVRPKWKLPSYLIKDEYKCRVQIFIKANGELIKANIYEASSNKEYDERALQSVRDSSPFPKVPDEISDRVSSGEIVLGFPL